MTFQFPETAAELADLIDIPLDRWPGNCHGVADAVRLRVPVQGMRLRRGHYLGPVSSSSVFRGGPAQHSWLELADGRILDPTRWCFTSPKKPEIFIGASPDYDEYGDRLKSRVPPMLGHPGAPLAPVVRKIGPTYFRDIFGRSKPGDQDDDTWVRLGNRLYAILKGKPDDLEDAQRIYAALEKAGLKMLVQTDKWVDVMEPERVASPVGRNRYFEIPPRPETSSDQTLLHILTTCLSVEKRGDGFERELKELGYSLGEWWDALNDLEAHIKMELPLKYLGHRHSDTLAVVTGELLGRGHGMVDEIEAYAKSLGWAPRDLHAKLSDLGQASGMDAGWL